MLENVHGQTEGVLYLQRVVKGQLTVPLLLLGPSGTGRRFSVLEAAKEVVCDDANQVYQIGCGMHPDVTVVSPESGKDLKVEVVRDLLEKAKFHPSRAPLRFLVVDGIDRATPAASNALLKVLEEAPSSVRFFLLAEREGAVIPTIKSRCATVRYRRLSEKFIHDKLQELTDQETRALVCSRLAEGSVGRAVHYLHSGKLSLREDILGMLSLVTRKDIKALFSAVDAAADDLSILLHLLEHLLHDLTMLPYGTSLLSNFDKIEALTKLREDLGPAKIDTLRSGLREVQARATLPINLVFHVKSLLASAAV